VTKKTGAYREYLNALEKYLRSFIARTRPLLDVDADRLQHEAEFERQWKDGVCNGWIRDVSSTKQHHGALAHTGAHLDLSPFNSAEELKSLGLDRLKSALMALNLKCGG
jgi:splicing factor 3A subunit 3